MTTDVQHTARTSERRFLKPYFKNHFSGMLIATIFSLLLGVVSAAVYGLLGPALKVLMTDKSATLATAELFGSQLGQMVARVTGSEELVAGELWQTLPALLIGLAALRMLLSTGSWFVWERIGELMSRSLRSDLMAKFMRLDPHTRLRRDQSQDDQLATVMTNDIRHFREYLVHYYGGLPRELFQIFFYVVTLVMLSPRLFAIFALGIMPAAYFMKRLGKKLKRRSKAALGDYSVLSEWLQQRLMGMETIKHAHTESLELKKMKTLSDNLFVRLVKAARVKARTSPLLQGVAIAAMAVILYAALQDIAASHSSGSVQLSFFATLAILGQSAAKLGRYVNSNKEGSAAVERIQSFSNFLTQNQKTGIAETVCWQKIDAALICEGVSVTYPQASSPALDKFSFQFARGRIYCLLGPSGAGKSTFFQAILGLVPFDGSIKASLNEDHEGKIGYLPQLIQTLPASIAENVAYPDQKGDMVAIEAALQAVGLNGLIGEMPKGLLTEVGSEGVGLSGGQAQRLAMARLIYHRYPVILIDEGTSALDPETEQLIYNAIVQLKVKGATIIMIAHRPSSLRIADEALYLDQGRLIRHGSPDTFAFP